jgi:hypothetical protein
MKEIELRDWNHFREYVSDSFSLQLGYIFRGQADRDWKLESTLTRLTRKISENYPPKALENMQLHNFKMRIRGLRGNNPQSLDENGLWALGQHYGLSTPLLDWTQSIYIAVYFAFESSSSCESGWRTIYALNKSKLIKDHPDLQKEGVEFIEPLYDDNKRIIAQAGLFSKIPVESDLESWLLERGLGSYLTKLHIENENRLTIINDLMLMNILGTSIYPDLHGSSVTCNMLIENLSENMEQMRSFIKMVDRLKLR